MDTPFLSGTHVVTLDAKNRLSVPAALRNKISHETHGKDFYFTTGTNKVPWLYPSKYFEEASKLKKTGLEPGQAQSKQERKLVGTAILIESDSQGRLTMPLDDYGYMGFSAIKDVREFYLVGCINRLELWTRPEWDETRRQNAENPMQIQDEAIEENKQAAQPDVSSKPLMAITVEELTNVLTALNLIKKSA